MKYIFEGERIKLNTRDYNRMLHLYPNIDLAAELEQLDFELRDTKKWWGTVQAKLNYRNKVSGKNQHRSSHADNIREQAKRALAALESADRGDDNSSIRPNGAAIPGKGKGLPDL